METLFVTMESNMIAYYTALFGQPTPAIALDGSQCGWLFSI